MTKKNGGCGLRGSQARRMGNERKTRMNVVIAEFDIFRLRGGGQTGHRKIIEPRPDIEFS